MEGRSDKIFESKWFAFKSFTYLLNKSKFRPTQEAGTCIRMCNIFFFYLMVFTGKFQDSLILQ